ERDNRLPEPFLAGAAQSRGNLVHGCPPPPALSYGSVFFLPPPPEPQSFDRVLLAPRATSSPHKDVARRSRSPPGSSTRVLEDLCIRDPSYQSLCAQFCQ